MVLYHLAPELFGNSCQKLRVNVPQVVIFHSTTTAITTRYRVASISYIRCRGCPSCPTFLLCGFRRRHCRISQGCGCRYGRSCRGRGTRGFPGAPRSFLLSLVHFHRGYPFRGFCHVTRGDVCLALTSPPCRPFRRRCGTLHTCHLSVAAGLTCLSPGASILLLLLLLLFLLLLLLLLLTPAALSSLLLRLRSTLLLLLTPVRDPRSCLLTKQYCGLQLIHIHQVQLAHPQRRRDRDRELRFRVASHPRSGLALLRRHGFSRGLRLRGWKHRGLLRLPLRQGRTHITTRGLFGCWSGHRSAHRDVLLPTGVGLPCCGCRCSRGFPVFRPHVRLRFHRDVHSCSATSKGVGCTRRVGVCPVEWESTESGLGG